jgi:glycosyltransferase involved in cell wall biosynthesis
MTPLVSVVLPTYNRARFLPQAFASVCAQRLGDWELIVVDDGSTDGTGELVATLARCLARPVRYVRQQNAGPAAARNAGLDLARGKYVAFHDSDDVWLPHHLDDCVSALEANPDVDKVGGACRRVDAATGRVLTPNTFYVAGRRRPFLRLRTRAAGRLRIIEDRGALRCAILHGVNHGLQAAVFRADVFRGLRLPPYHVGEDQLFAILQLAAGHRLGYLDNVHAVYTVHDNHTSAAGADPPLEKRLAAFRAIAEGLEGLRRSLRLTPDESRALDRRLSEVYFWNLGYPLFWDGRRREALALYRKALRLDPGNVSFWKTYLLALARTAARRALPGRSPPRLTSARAEA